MSVCCLLVRQIQRLLNSSLYNVFGGVGKNWPRGRPLLRLVGISTGALPLARLDKLLRLLSELSESGRSVDRKLVEQCIGLLLWFCGGAYWLKPWLVTPSLQACLQSPLRLSISAGSAVTYPMGWLLFAILRRCFGMETTFCRNCLASDLDSPAIQRPKMKHGCNYQHCRVKVCRTWAAQLFATLCACKQQRRGGFWTWMVVCQQQTHLQRRMRET